MTHNTPYRLGLTGGIAAGKSEVQRILTEQGIPVLDTDRVAHEVMKAGSNVHQQIVQRFGREILLENQEINRKRLGEIVFGDESARRDLNGIVHPEVGNRWRSWMNRQSDPLVVVSIPLLFECGLQMYFDGVLCVWAPESLMMKRLLSRGLNEEQAQQRIQSQWSVDRKRNASTWALVNDGSLEDLRDQVLEWLHQFFS